MTSCREATLLEQHGHHDQIFINPVDQKGVALQALDFEPDFLVQCDGVCIVFPDGQFDPVKSEDASGSEGPLDQLPADTFRRNSGSKPIPRMPLWA
jgi:hypothetical protein